MSGVPLEPNKDWLRDTERTINYTRRSPFFIKENKLWKGFRQYRWLMKGGLIILAILGFDILFSLDDLTSANVSQAETIPSWTDVFTAISLPDYLDGGMKYVLLIAIEIIIFHFTRRSMMIITGEKIDTSFNTFMKAEWRMVKVAIFSFFMESVFTVLSNTLFSLAGTSEAAPVMIFLIQSFYLGFAIIDNFNELFHMTLRQSHRYTWHFAPVAIITGAIVNVMLLIPGIGVVIGTVICSVIATLTMHELTKKSGGMDWVFVENKKVKKPKEL